jgi:hypothetical protein
VLGRHCSDERLLALLDEGLDPASRVMIPRHLRSCRICLERLKELDDQIHTLSSAWQQADLIPPSEIEQARSRFLAWTRTGTVELGHHKWHWLRLWSTFRVPAIAGMSALVLIAGATAWRFDRVEPVASTVPGKSIATTRVRPPVVPSQPQSTSTQEVAPAETTDVVTESPVVQPAAPTHKQLLETEIEVWWLLHRAGACNGEPIEIATINERRIFVHGVVASRARQQELVSALRKLSGRESIRFKLEAAEDVRVASNARPLATPLPQRPAPSDSDLEFQRAAADSLRGMYPLDTPNQTHQRLVGITNRAIWHVERATMEAWAIRRLRDRFRDTGPQLSARTRQVLETMTVEHVQTLHSLVVELSGLLEPLLSRMVAEDPPLNPSRDLLDSVERLRQLVETAFVGDSSSLGSPAQVSGEIASLDKLVANELSDGDAVVARMFPDFIVATPEQR